jgi:hypothetical protein
LRLLSYLPSLFAQHTDEQSPQSAVLLAVDQQVLVLREHDLFPNFVDVSPDGTKLASGTSGEVRIWALDIDDLLEIARRT